MAHTDLILVAALFCWGSVCWLFIMHFGATTVISRIRSEALCKHLILEIYARSIFDRISRVSFLFLTLGFIRKYIPKLPIAPEFDYIDLFISVWPLVRSI